MYIILISACADPVNRPEIKSLHFGGSLDVRIGRTGFITARVPREATAIMDSSPLSRACSTCMYLKWTLSTCVEH